MHYIKVTHPLATTNPVPVGSVPIVRDDGRTATGARIPSADLHARRIAREAERWLKLAEERSRMRPDTLTRKTLDSVAFSVRHGASSFAIPSKLTGTKAHQRALWRLVREIVPRWAELDVEETPSGGLLVSHDGETLGEVQSKHVPWARPLIPFGLRLYLDRVTGHENQGWTLGCNYVLAHAGEAVDALLHALGAGDGAGDEAPASDALAAAVAPPEPAGGDGASGTVVPVREEHEALHGSREDIVLWRDGAGSARASVELAGHYSPTGFGFGRDGAGATELAHSILIALTDAETAERLCVEFREEVVARVPHCGGLLRAADVRGWLAARGASSAPSVA